MRGSSDRPTVVWIWSKSRIIIAWQLLGTVENRCVAQQSVHCSERKLPVTAAKSEAETSILFLVLYASLWFNQWCASVTIQSRRHWQCHSCQNITFSVSKNGKLFLSTITIARFWRIGSLRGDFVIIISFWCGAGLLFFGDLSKSGYCYRYLVPTWR